jgi:hypothetical protein
MTPERWQQVKSVCARALERDAAERDAFVEDACLNDPDLLEHVRTFLDCAGDGTDVLEPPAWRASR